MRVRRGKREGGSKRYGGRGGSENMEPQFQGPSAVGANVRMI